MSALSTHEGSCHCGAVRFSVTLDVTRAIACNCSICSKVGALFAAASPSQLTMHTDEEALTRYQFGTMTATHYFCARCGVHPFVHPRIAPHMWGVNLRCLEGVQAESLPVDVFDGRALPQNLEPAKETT